MASSPESLYTQTPGTLAYDLHPETNPARLTLIKAAAYHALSVEHGMDEEDRALNDALLEEYRTDLIKAA